MSYTVSEKTFGETQYKANQLHDLMFILSNYGDLDTNQVNPFKQEGAIQIFDAYQHVASVTSAIISLVGEINDNFDKMENEAMASKQAVKAVSHD